MMEGEGASYGLLRKTFWTSFWLASGVFRMAVDELQKALSERISNAEIDEQVFLAKPWP